MTLLYVGNSQEALEKCSKENMVSFTAVTNSLEAIQVLNNRSDIDVIISQYNLPGNNGLFLYDRICEDTSLREIPFILLTEEFSKNIFDKSFKKGISDYFVSNNTEVQQIISKAKSLTNFKRNNEGVTNNKTKNVKYELPVSKRIFDVAFASFILLLISPFLFIILFFTVFDIFSNPIRRDP